MIDSTSQLVFALRWYIAIQLFGLAALPLCLRLLRRLPDRGYSVSKPFGLLLAGWVFWLLTTLGWSYNTVGGIVLALILVAIAGLSLHFARPDRGPAVQISWRTVLLVEGVFVLAFVAWCLVRAHMPNIEPSGGEKWMESAFLRAILRSDTFPPHDPWLSGFAISYYHFGYLIIAALTRLAAVPPAVAFNLAVASWFALACVGVFGLVANLVSLGKRRRSPPAGASLQWGWINGWAPLGGLLGVVLVTVMGNLEVLFEILHARGIGSRAFWQWVDIETLAQRAPPALADGSWVPTRFFWWWQASRVIRDYTPTGAHQEVIDEFPGFSFLLGDIHPHVLGLPFVLLALFLALNLYLRGRDGGQQKVWPFAGWEFGFYAVCLGGLGFLNAWDMPIYLFIVAAAHVLAKRYDKGRSLRDVVRDMGLRFVGVLGSLSVAGFLLYYPFWHSFQSQASGLLPNPLNGTRLPQFIIMFGPLLVIAIGFVVVEARRSKVEAGRVFNRTLLVMASIVALLVAIVGVALFLLQAGVIQPQGALSYVDAWLRGDSIPDVGEVPGLWTLVRQRLLVDSELYGPAADFSRPGIVVRAVLASPVWVVFGLVAFLVATVLVLWRRMVEEEYAVRDFCLLLFGTGALLVLSVEFVYVRDHFGTRMNTVFKFYFQTWVLWGVAGAYALLAMARRGGGIGTVGILAFATCLIVVGLLYPALAIPARAAEQGGPVTLDGIEHLSRSHAADYQAIAWLNNEVVGARVILEEPGGGYEYAGRVSAHTGLPTVLGWSGHEWQWRGSFDEQNRRSPDIDTIYTGLDLDVVSALLDTYDITYVYVGSLERGRYPAEGLEKFDLLMNVVYDRDDVTIYERR